MKILQMAEKQQKPPEQNVYGTIIRTPVIKIFHTQSWKLVNGMQKMSISSFRL